MAIHDVSKNTGDRGNPSPNTHDLLEGLQKAHGTESVTYINQRVATLLEGNLSLRTVPPAQPIAYGQTQVSGSSTLNWHTTPHGLGFVPVVTAALNNSTITLGDGTKVTGSASIALPTFTSVTVDPVAGYIKANAWLNAMADINNVYIFLFNATGSNLSYTVTYYLYQQPAN